jgi:hypothetical protein
MHPNPRPPNSRRLPGGLFVAEVGGRVLVAKREERYEFPHLRHRISADRLQTMAAALLAAEALAPTRPHPGVETAAANVALGPQLAFIDQVRDTVRSAMSP